MPKRDYLDSNMASDQEKYTEALPKLLEVFNRYWDYLQDQEPEYGYVIPDRWFWKFKTNAGKNTLYDAYHHDGVLFAYLFTLYGGTYRQEIEDIVGFPVRTVSGFVVPANRVLCTHLDNNIVRSSVTTNFLLEGAPDATTTLYTDDGDLMFEVDGTCKWYQLRPNKVVHGFKSGSAQAKLLNVWHHHV
ncbi:hypothetical protein RsoM2USA_46 [Ralstonia phage RsoM2USA]|nr:hypothetical protein RsoM2USA_46 [Ralstonia phage RsoM2USA]